MARHLARLLQCSPPMFGSLNKPLISQAQLVQKHPSGLHCWQHRFWAYPAIVQPTMRLGWPLEWAQLVPIVVRYCSKQNPIPSARVTAPSTRFRASGLRQALYSPPRTLLVNLHYCSLPAPPCTPSPRRSRLSIFVCGNSPLLSNLTPSFFSYLHHDLQ